MIAQVLLTAILFAVLLYAWKEQRNTPIVGLGAALIAACGLYFVWIPHHATSIAAWTGIGRGADLILYGWSAFSLIALLNLHLKVRAQAEVMTGLARAIALSDADRPVAPARAPQGNKPKAAASSRAPARPSSASGRRRRA